jgi:hypothetical protein
MAKRPKENAPKASTSKVKPTYLKSGKSFKMGLHDVVKVLKVIEESGHLDKFVKAAKRNAKKNKAFVTVDHRTVNFVKDFIVKHEMHAHPIGMHIVNAEIKKKDPFRPCSLGEIA